MKKNAIFFTFLLLFPACIFADEAELSHFCREYSEVNHSLMSDQGCLKEFMELHSLDITAAGHIADFWLFKAKRECYDFVEKIKSNIEFKDLYKEIDFYVDKTTTTNISGGKYSEIQEKAQKEAEQCRYCVYYDNWDAINKMISDKLKAVKEENRKKEQQDKPTEKTKKD